MAEIVIINPRFDTSFWGMEHCVGLFGKRANLPVACLALLAALVPDHHHVTLIDENVEDINFDRLGRADLICLTGMCIQGRRMCEILREVKSRSVMTVVGGPLATVEERALIGQLHAIPTTPLYDRLKREGRLNGEADSNLYGTNVVPLNISRSELRDGFIEVMKKTYSLDAYFRPLDALFIDQGFDVVLYRLPYWRRHRLAWALQLLGAYINTLGIS